MSPIIRVNVCAYVSTPPECICQQQVRTFCLPINASPRKADNNQQHPTHTHTHNKLFSNPQTQKKTHNTQHTHTHNRKIQEACGSSLRRGAGPHHLEPLLGLLRAPVLVGVHGPRQAPVCRLQILLRAVPPRNQNPGPLGRYQRKTTAKPPENERELHTNHINGEIHGNGGTRGSKF